MGIRVAFCRGLDARVEADEEADQIRYDGVREGREVVVGARRGVSLRPAGFLR